MVPRREPHLSPAKRAKVQQFCSDALFRGQTKAYPAFGLML